MNQSILPGRYRPLVAAAAMAVVHSATTDAPAAIIGINSANSFANMVFDDTHSATPSSNPGITFLPTGVSPWTGAALNLGLTTDPITLDKASASITASFTAATYSLSVNALLQQIPGNTGYAQLTFNFAVEFQTDGSGLPSLPTMSQIYNIIGTVQPSASFSSFDGTVTYTSGTLGVVDQVNYVYLNSAPGPYNVFYSGVAANGTTPALSANDTLTLSGLFVFKVDPATIIATPVPEPSAAGFLVCGLGAFALRRRVFGSSYRALRLPGLF